MTKSGGTNWKNVNRALRKDAGVKAKLQALADEAAQDVILSLDMDEHSYFVTTTEGIVVENPRSRPAAVVRIGGGYAQGRLTARALEESNNYLTSAMTSLMASEGLKKKKKGGK